MGCSSGENISVGGCVWAGIVDVSSFCVGEDGWVYLGVRVFLSVGSVRVFLCQVSEEGWAF